MPSVRLLYFSRATRELALSDMQDILATARSNNAEINVCGMLCYDNRYFLQALEGDRAIVSELYLDIADDPRHDDVVLLSLEEIQAPEFNDWGMGYASSSPRFNQLLTELKQDVFEPGALSQQDALNLLVQLSQQQDNI